MSFQILITVQKTPMLTINTWRREKLFTLPLIATSNQFTNRKRDWNIKPKFLGLSKLRWNRQLKWKWENERGDCFEKKRKENGENKIYRERE